MARERWTFRFVVDIAGWSKSGHKAAADHAAAVRPLLSRWQRVVLLPRSFT
jgi:hypothetical protein